METRLIVVFVVSAAVLLAVWYMSGALVTPVEPGRNIGVELRLRASGSAPELEHTVYGLLWLIENGTIPGEVVIIDGGMDDYTRLTAEMLAKSERRVHFLQGKQESNGARDRAD